LNAGNTYGVAGTPGAAFDGGTVIRHGTITFSHESALSSTVVEMGDTHRALSQNAYLATTSSLITSGTAGGAFDAASDGAGGSGAGAFLNVKAEVDGVALTVADVGKWILVKDEGINPERNGVYQIVSVDGTCAQMNLVRVGEFDEGTEMLYGTSVGVTAGTHAGLRYFMASRDVTAVNADDTDPVHWMAETANPDIALLATVSGMDVINGIDINDTNGTGSTTIGGTFASGTSTFFGEVTLQHHTLPGVDNNREVELTSASDSGTGARGTIFAGVISEADAGDTLSVRVTGPGTVTMSNVNTYKGKTTVASGTLALEGAGSINETSWLEVAQNATFDTAAVSGVDYTLDTVVSGSGTVVTGTGKFTVGTDGGPGTLRPGMSSDPSNVATAGNLVGTLSVNGNLELSGDATGVNRWVLQLGATNGADHNDAANIGTQLGAGTFDAWLETQADTYDAFTGGNHDRVVISGSLELHAGGSIVLTNNGGTDYVPQFGDIFNLLDWADASFVQNDFSYPDRSTGGLQGDLDLPTLSGGLAFDTSIFDSHGILVVVPEPGRALLLMVGLVCLLGRRRR
jgi:autotransporter-associated beta strand protein